ncbi:ABC transporter ATP-binding protein [Actinotalea sp. C106]|uniref:ABC transporter ATP-binding protein n=1 Tax=Actinotalea sp. C106 TaxID=2908644 RepID=UPI002028F245|nr:ABC transporter ATP-binding protein [Actinotalea sp. C106]
MLEVRHLTKRYGSRTVVDDVSLDVADGEVVGIVGPNGAGKTSLVECVEGLRRPDRGHVSIGGHDPFADRREVRQLLGAQLQHAAPHARLRVEEVLDLYRSFYRDGEDPVVLMERLGLAEQRRTLSAQLSGGQQQRLAVATALVGSPRLAILDELTTGLDPHGRRDVWSLLRDYNARGLTIVLVSHFMDEVEHLCDRVAVLSRGALVTVGTPRDLVARTGTSTLDEAFITLTGTSPGDLGDGR